MSNKLVQSVKTQNLALKLKLNPTQEQKQSLNKTFGCARFVYNYLLNEKNQFYEKEIRPLGNDKKAKNAVWKTFEQSSPKQLKEKFPWLKESNSQALCAAQMNLNAAYRKFYSGSAKLPRFHSKKSKNAFKDCMMKQDFLNWNEKTVLLPKIGKIKFTHRNLPAWFKDRTKVCSYTCSRNPSGSYYITILFEVKMKFTQKSKSNAKITKTLLGLHLCLSFNGKVKRMVAIS